MVDEINESVPEVAPQEINDQVQETLQQDTQVSSSTQTQKTDTERNFKQLREKAERLERERDEALRRLDATNAQKLSNEDESVDIRPDELVEGKHLSSYQKKLKKMEERLAIYEEQAQELAIQAQLKAKFPDFDAIVSKENIEKFREQEPEWAEAIAANPNTWSKAVAAYKAIKQSGIIIDNAFAHERALAQKNTNKPRPLSSISPQQGDTPLSRANAFANGLTDDLKKQLWKEIEESRKLL